MTGKTEALTTLELNKDEIISKVLTDTSEKAMKEYCNIAEHDTTTAETGSIVIQEKLDGVNVSFMVENGKLRVFLRNEELSSENDLHGFYNWAVDNITINNLLPNFVYFGEWLTKDNIDYGKENTNKFYLFDVYSLIAEEYCELEDVELEAEALGVKIVPILYTGEVKDINLESIVGKSKLNPDVNAEGVVIKNYGEQKFTKVTSPTFTK